MGLEMSWEPIFVFSIFVFTYFIFISGKIRSSLIAFSMGLLIILSKAVKGFNLQDLGRIIDFNTIGLLIGMMIIVGVMKTTGVFQYVAIKVVKLVKANFRLIFVFFSITIFVFSAFLDNVTTILLFSPLIFLITDTLEIDPTIFMLVAMFSANIGGTATLIGDPPNILVGSASKKSFLDFIGYMGPIALLMLAIVLSFYAAFFKSYFKVNKEKLNNFLTMDPKKVITDRRLFLSSLIVFFGVIIGFLLHEMMDYEMALIALFGASVILIVSKKSFEEISSSIEWDTIFFFIGLFTLAYAMEEVGIIRVFTRLILEFSDHPLILGILIIWLSGIISAFIGAVPTVVVMIPIVKALVNLGLSQDLWWALAMGASFGGNGTITGTAANMIGSGLLEKHLNTKANYLKFMKHGFPVMLLCLLISSFYYLIRMLW